MGLLALPVPSSLVLCRPMTCTYAAHPRSAHSCRCPSLAAYLLPRLLLRTVPAGVYERLFGMVN